MPNNTPDHTEDRHDFYRALANCEITFLDHAEDREYLNNIPQQLFNEPIKVTFGKVARACASSAVAFDPVRNLNFMKMNSTLAAFKSEDSRSMLFRAVAGLSGNRHPRDLPRLFQPLIGRMLTSNGVGEVIVAQDLSKQVDGEVAAKQEGRDAPFFPAHSWFDQFLIVKAMGKTYTNREKLRVVADVDVWPPQGQIYKSLGVTPFYSTDESDPEPAFLFGNCTINIVEALDRPSVEKFTEMQMSVQGTKNANVS